MFHWLHSWKSYRWDDVPNKNQLRRIGNRGTYAPRKFHIAFKRGFQPSSNHHFSGAMLNFGGAHQIFWEKTSPFLVVFLLDLCFSRQPNNTGKKCSTLANNRDPMVRRLVIAKHGDFTWLVRTTPTFLLICSSSSKEKGHLLLICPASSSLSIA